MNPRTVLAALTAVVLISAATPADARRVVKSPDRAPVLDVSAVAPYPTEKVTRERGKRTRDAQPSYVRISNSERTAGVVGGRPSGCPSRFCGCEASLYVFGTIRAELNLAYNWVRKFPRTEPAPGMVAARSGHVMVLMSHAGGNDWMVHDGNGGRGKTWEHVRSIRGYTIVNPHASSVADPSGKRL